MSISTERREFVDKWTPLVMDLTKNNGLLPSVFLAQAIIESADRAGHPAKSTLAAKYRNYFGIKASSDWKGKTVNLATGEILGGQAVTINSNFRVYSTISHSFRDRVKFLTQNPRYTKAGVFRARDYRTQAQALQLAGYATSPNYSATLISIIESLGLARLDTKKKTI